MCAIGPGLEGLGAALVALETSSKQTATQTAAAAPATPRRTLIALPSTRDGRPASAHASD
jgi:hypothetical protein